MTMTHNPHDPDPTNLTGHLRHQPNDAVVDAFLRYNAMHGRRWRSISSRVLTSEDGCLSARGVIASTHRVAFPDRDTLKVLFVANGKTMMPASKAYHLPLLIRMTQRSPFPHENPEDIKDWTIIYVPRPQVRTIHDKGVNTSYHIENLEALLNEYREQVDWLCDPAKTPLDQIVTNVCLGEDMGALMIDAYVRALPLIDATATRFDLKKPAHYTFKSRERSSAAENFVAKMNLRTLQPLVHYLAVTRLVHYGDVMDGTTINQDLFDRIKLARDFIENRISYVQAIMRARILAEEAYMHPKKASRRERKAARAAMMIVVND